VTWPEFGITVRAIRFYEDRGLLQPRRQGSACTYGPRERLHLKMILKRKELGFTLSEIRDIVTARAAETTARDFEIYDLSPADFGAIGMCPAGPRALDAMQVDLALALRPDQIVARIDHLERQRKALDDAILSLREAHHRRVARDGCGALRRSEQHP
jgi:DNA-binding transcriptional MerR regulator